MNHRMIVSALALTVGVSSVASFCFAKPATHTKKAAPKPVAAKDASQGDSSAWAPNPAILATLQQSAPFGPFSLRLPKGYKIDPKMQMRKETDKSTTTAYMARTPDRPDGTFGVIAVYVSEFKNGLKPVDMDGMLNGAVDSNPSLKGQPGIIKSDVQSGTIGDLKATRMYFKFPDNPGAKHFTHGFNYASANNQATIVISTLDTEPYFKKSLPLAEAAALTLHQSE